MQTRSDLVIAIQTALAIIGAFSGYQSYTFSEARLNYGEHIDSGLDGGALAFGIICASCIACFVWLEVVKMKRS